MSQFLVVNTYATLLAILLHCCQHGIASANEDDPTSRPLSTGLVVTTKSWYEKRVDRYYQLHEMRRKWEQIQQGRKTWPKKKGRCEHSPWMIDGVNPVMEESKRGVYM